MTTEIINEQRRVGLIFDRVIMESNLLFKQMLLANATLQLGKRALEGISDDALFKTTVGVETEIEPIFLREIRIYSNGLPNFLRETFHGRMVQVWQDCLSSIFEALVNMHFSGTRRFVELKTKSINLHFGSSEDYNSQIISQLTAWFEFEKYRNRISLIDSTLKSGADGKKPLEEIRKHVHIRNSIQHNRGVIDEFTLKELGLKSVKVLDQHGKEKLIGNNEQLLISIPEFDSFRRSVLRVCQEWRKWNVSQDSA